LGLIPRSLRRKTGGAEDLFLRIRKDFKEKSSICARQAKEAKWNILPKKGVFHPVNGVKSPAFEAADLADTLT
jgi:hypothetical protein